MKQKFSLLMVLCILTGIFGTIIGETTATEGIYVPGSYEVEAQGFGGAIKTVVTFDENNIKSVEVLENIETPGIGSTAIEEMPKAFVEANSAEVDSISGATITSLALKEAVSIAIKQAKGESDESIIMTDGVYEGTGPAYRGNVTLAVTVKDNAISAVEILESTDTYMIGVKAYEQLTEQVITHQSLGVDSISGATVSSNGFFAAMSDALSKAGADITALKAVSIEKRAPETTSFDSDILVIGGGMAGMTAAIQAADDGASVILIEKLGVFGGSTTRSEGYVMGAGTDYQKEQGVNDSADAFYKDIMSVYDIEPLLNADLIKKVIYDSADLITFLQENDVKFEKLVAVSTFEPRATPRNHCSANKGSGLTNALVANLEKKGVKVFMNTAATEIINQDGVVVGAKATNQFGDDITFNAKATILCAGSYGGNVEMMKKLNPNIVAESIKGSGDGDGFTLAENAGAKMLLLDYPQLQYYLFWDGIPKLPVYPASAIAPVKNILLTDGVGKRVANEADFNFEFIAKVYYSGQQEGYCIVGKDFYAQYPEVCEAGLGKTFPSRGDEIALKADTVEELAKWANLDPAILTETVNRYNELCDLGKDLDFNKDTQDMQRIDPPYYIMKLPAVVTDGYSGAVINENAQIIGVDDKPIPGFYAAGCCAVPEMSCVNYYGCGTSLMTCGVYGRAAAQHAVTYCLTK